MTDILFRYATEADWREAMTALGFTLQDTGREEELLGHVCTPPMTTHQGIVRTVRFTDPEQLAKVPDVLSPTFLVDWRSDEDNTDYDPTYTADLTDAEGNLYVGTVWPGRIA